jgi:hypothetical protein
MIRKSLIYNRSRERRACLVVLAVALVAWLVTLAAFAATPYYIEVTDGSSSNLVSRLVISGGSMIWLR